MTLTKILSAFSKIGFIGFGGGSALIPVLEKEVVQNVQMVNEDEFTEYVIVANITPGALPVKIAEGIGQKLKSIKGGILSAFSMAIPGSVMCVFLLSLLSVIDITVLKQVEYLSVGISAFIIFLILYYIKKVITDSKTQDFFVQSIVITLFSFFITFGKEIRLIISDIFGIPYNNMLKPIFDIQTVDLLFLAFFIIFFTCGKFERKRATVATIVSILFLLTVGKCSFIAIPFFKAFIYILMTILLIVFLIFDIKKESKGYKPKIELKIPFMVVGVFSAVIIVLLLIIIIFFKNSSNKGVLDYTINGMLSTATSFGGGEAFLSVAEGFFVESGFLKSDVFYNQVVPIANALPGPILVKILAGIGYVFGFNTSGGNILAGSIYSLLGISVGVGTSASIFCIIFSVYESFKELKIFAELKKWILPVICGLLLSTILSMLHEMFRTTSGKGIISGVAIIFFVAILILNYFLHKKLKIKDIFLILISGSISLIILNI